MSEDIEEAKKLLVEKNLTYAGQLSFLAYTTRLEEKNQRLNEELKDEEQWRIKIAKERDELHKECLNHIEQKKLYKEVIEEVREYIESKNNGVCIVNGEEKPAYTFLLDFREAREFVWELLQILDKVKENK